MASLSVGQKGQSLVEVIVACGILAIALTAMMSMVTASKNLLYQSEDQMKATSLAQEGIEIAKHQRDIGCSWSKIKNTDGTLKNGPFVIKGDIDLTNDEDIQPFSDTDPHEIENFDGFARFIIIEELTSNTSGISLDGFQNVDCGDSNKNYDCLNKYYAIRVDIHEGDGWGPIISQVRTIMSKE